MKDDLKGVNKDLTNTVFLFLNQFDIRHKNEKQVVFISKEEKIKYYDMGFKLIIHLLRVRLIKDYENQIKERITIKNT